ncbi:hypothetical protein GCM10028819_00810 [Spirosoma humi]
MSKILIYYSVNTRLAYEINEKYYNNMHYVWCSPFFHEVGQPASSNPKEIYKELRRDVESEDEHSAKIRQNVSGIRRGARFKHDNRLISFTQFEEIKAMVNRSWQRKIFSDFTPFIYIIPHNAHIETILKPVGLKDKASIRSIEYQIKELPRDLFDVISVDY